MRPVAIVVTSLIWLACWVVAPASWWLNERILDEQAFDRAVEQVLQIEDVDTAITQRATAQVMDEALAFVERNVPVAAGPAETLLDAAEPTVTDLVGKAVNSQPGQRAMRATAEQMHTAFVAWLEQDTLGRPGWQADLAEGQARFDIDELLAGQSLSVGPVAIPLDALDLPGLSVPFPLPPDWMRAPLVLVRDAWLPSLLGIASCAVLLVVLDRGRSRALAAASAVTALVVGLVGLFIGSASTTAGMDSGGTVARAVTELLVEPLLTAYTWVVIGLVLLALIALFADRMVVRRARA